MLLAEDQPYPAPGRSQNQTGASQEKLWLPSATVSFTRASAPTVFSPAR
jgi:hypothetical protein